MNIRNWIFAAALFVLVLAALAVRPVWRSEFTELVAPTPPSEPVATSPTPVASPRPPPTNLAAPEATPTSTPAPSPTPATPAGVPPTTTTDDLGMLRTANGALALLRRTDADAACRNKGMRLANIRELVSWGSNLVEKSAGEALDPPGTHAKEFVRAIHPTEKLDEFYVVYLNTQGSIAVLDELRGKSVFSSSRNADNPAEYFSLESNSGYVSSGETPDPDPRYHLGAGRCLPRENQ